MRDIVFMCIQFAERASNVQYQMIIHKLFYIIYMNIYILAHYALLKDKPVLMIIRGPSVRNSCGHSNDIDFYCGCQLEGPSLTEPLCEKVTLSARLNYTRFTK